MTPLDQPGTVRITIEAADPQLAVRTGYHLAMLTGGGGPSDPEPAGDGTVRVWLYARPEGDESSVPPVPPG
ncbi:hypothetical protein OHB04_02530 [Streptomyces sp. NBC_01775]|uniref:hypothetical protein n=1 Tax=Streptomyces sp. NBC_01775 TaxID=2975939 RepID=UPI002DDA96F3|nr:hypothetical protein [Streptomyces sp. NBC_01775]WSB74770.1 hypothetical protein OHB04_02530 [Streptomyces sp. NBC_01775]